MTIINPYHAKLIYSNFHPLKVVARCRDPQLYYNLKLCLTTATHNVKWLKITHICLIWAQIFATLDV